MSTLLRSDELVQQTVANALVADDHLIGTGPIHDALEHACAGENDIGTARIEAADFSALGKRGTLQDRDLLLHSR